MTPEELEAVARGLVESYEGHVAHRERLAAANPGFRVDPTPGEEVARRRAELARAYLALAADRERLAAEVLAGPPWQPAAAVAALIRKEPTT